MQRSSGSGQGGFSLIELTVAMAVTMIVSGAIFGLLAGGQTAFRREPELSDRQQNIRVAMDLILRDIANAGSGMPNFMQTFTQGLDACGTCPQGPDGLVTDQLEMATNAAAIDNVAACSNVAAADNNDSHMLHLMPSVTTITPDTPVVLTMADGRWTVRNVVAVSVDPAVVGRPAGGSYENCSSEVPAVPTPHVLLDLGATGDTSGMNVDGNLCVPTPAGVGNVAGSCDVVEVGFAELVRYQIVLDPQGVPLLQRWTSANAAALPQTIARGIEELQVQYIQAGFDPTVAANWQDNAPTVIPDAWNTLITQVRVTLSARSEAQNVQGATRATSGPDALRGRLAAVGSPRSSLHALTRVPVPSPAPSPLPQLWR